MPAGGSHEIVPPLANNQLLVLAKSLPPGWKHRLHGRQDARRYGSAQRTLTSPPASGEVRVPQSTRAMPNPTANRVLRTALFTLVLLAYLSMGLWSPAGAYTKSGRVGVSPGLAVCVDEAGIQKADDPKLLPVLEAVRKGKG